jgi:hypothetical protein
MDTEPGVLVVAAMAAAIAVMQAEATTLTLLREFAHRIGCTHQLETR